MLVIPVALIARQPDLGTAVLITAAGFFVLFLAGLSWRIIAGLAVAGAASAALRCGRRCTTTSASAS